MRTDLPGNLGNANTWNERAAAQGFPVDGSPRPGDIAVFEAGSKGAGSYGHVAYVESVNGNGTITISEWNWTGPCQKSIRAISPAGLSFIHRKGPPPPPPVPVFDDVHVYSSDILTVTAGDSVGAIVTARYAGGPASIPCGLANLGVRGDAPAQFADLSDGYWPAGRWRSPNRVAAVGCIGDLDVGEHARWDLKFKPPRDLSPGVYTTGVYAPVWDGRAWSDQQIPIRLNVVSPYQAEFAGESFAAHSFAPAETGAVTFKFRNSGRTTLYRDGSNPTRCRASHPIDRVSKWINPNGADVVFGNGGPQGVKIDQSVVQPGEPFSCTIPLKAPAAIGTSQEYFSPVTEGKAWMFNNGHDDVWVQLASADPNHVPFSAPEYGAGWITQSGPQDPIAAGGSGTLQFTFRNTGMATLYRDGSNPTRCRASHPIDRVSKWINPNGADVVFGNGGPQGVKIDQSVVQPGETFSCTIPLKAPAAIGTSQEYFSPVTEGKAWMFNNGHDDVWFPLTSR